MTEKNITTQPKSFTVILPLFVACLLLASCALPGGLGSTPSPIAPAVGSNQPTSTTEPASPTAQVVEPAATLAPQVDFGATDSAIAATQTALVPLATPTSLPPSPTPILAANNNVTPSGTVIFTTGTTAGVVQGAVTPGQVLSYTIGVGQSQPMVLIMDAPNSDVTLGLFDPNGAVLIDPANHWWNWQGLLPMSGLYTIEVIGGATTENFVLTIKIAQMVNFATGTSSSTLSGTTINGYLYDYALYCNAGQNMTASLDVPASTAYLDIFGLVNGTLLSDSARVNSWSGVLPQSQYYIVEVVPNNNQVVNYNLTLSCTGIASNVPPPPPVNYPGNQAGDITIAAGSTAAVRQGTIGPGQILTYTIQGYQYQPIILNVDSPNYDVTLGLLDPNGTLMFDPANKYLNWQMPLHITGLYTIQVIGGSYNENYSLTVKLPKQVYLGNGTTSETITSATEQGFVVSYVINGNAGETLTASLNVPSTVAYLDIFGVESGSLLSYKAKANNWTGNISNTELYVIEVIPRGGWIVQYSLTLTLK